MTTRLLLALAALPHQGAWADDPLARPAAGRSFDEFVQAALQDYAVPGQSLGMVRSGPTEAELFKDDNRAADHNFDGSIMPYENVDAFSGAGAVVSRPVPTSRAGCARCWVPVKEQMIEWWGRVGRLRGARLS